MRATCSANFVLVYLISVLMLGEDNIVVIVSKLYNFLSSLPLLRYTKRNLRGLQLTKTAINTTITLPVSTV
jgi:hypothetical protein